MRHEPFIQAVVVNHNTSAYTELMLRSLYATHASLSHINITVLDNGSQDDLASLRAFAGRKNIPILPTGFSLQTRNNSHGEVLRTFVLSRPECDYYLFLDTDVVFVQNDTIPTLLRELEEDPGAFGAGPVLSWDGIQPLPEAVLQNPDIYTARLHPCCALVKNSTLFRCVVEEVGLSSARMLWAERDEYLDTFKLMTRVMKTHGLHHRISSAMVLHFFCASYEWDPPEFRSTKLARRDALLAQYRRME